MNLSVDNLPRQPYYRVHVEARLDIATCPTLEELTTDIHRS
jgi:hypothetical protein